jgi:eukaryotic-like serine/threonine-protein kinase
MIAAGAWVLVPPATESSPPPHRGKDLPELKPPPDPQAGPQGGGQDESKDSSSRTPGPQPPIETRPPGQPQEQSSPVSQPRNELETRSPPENPTQRLSRYVHDYEGGDCFYLVPMELRPNSAVVEGFGSSAASFEAFDMAFRRAHGFEATINVRLVADAQCPAVSFMKSVGANGDGAPKLQVDSFVLKTGDSLGGRVGDLGARHVYILLVGDDGYVYNLLEHVKQKDTTVRFNFRPSRAGSQGSRPQLIMAIATSKPMALLSGGKPVAGDVIFPLLLDEARTLGLNIDLAVKYVHLE